MPSWSDLPTEIKLIVVHNYIDLVITEINEHGIDHPPRRGYEATWVDYGKRQILNLMNALPSLRIDILRLCGAQEAAYEKEHLEEWLEPGKYKMLTSQWALMMTRLYGKEISRGP